MTRLYSEITALVGEDNVLFDEPMRAHTTFRVGGPADVLVAPRSAQEVRDVLGLCREAGVRSYILGRGSNLLVSDEGLRGVVVQISGNLAALDVAEDGTIVTQAGATNAKVAAAASRASLAGYEFAAGIPGTVGGAAVMNAGAYDGEFKHVCTGVTCLSQDGDLIEVDSAAADWGYRSSMMQREGFVVLEATLKLHPGNRDDIQARMDELARRRSEKQPLDVPSAGSTFKRPPGQYAGKLIQDAGMQGYRVGGAEVSTKHAGFVVNRGGATAADVRQVVLDVRDAVAQKFGVLLEPEVRMWGFE